MEFETLKPSGVSIFVALERTGIHFTRGFEQKGQLTSEQKDEDSTYLVIGDHVVISSSILADTYETTNQFRLEAPLRRESRLSTVMVFSMSIPALQKMKSGRETWNNCWFSGKLNGIS